MPPPPPASPPSAEGPEDLREPAFPEVPDEADEGQEQLRADEAVDERPDAADLPPAGPATAETGRATDATAAGGAPERASGTAADDASSAESSGSGAAEGGPTSLPSRTTGARRATFPLRPRVVRPEARRAASDAGADTGEAAAPTADTAGPDVAPGAVAGSVTDTGRHAGALEAGATEGFATEGERAVVGPHTAEPYPSASEGPDPGGLRPDGPAGDAAPGSGPAEAVAPDDEGAPAAPAHAGTDAGGATGTPGAAGETRDRPPARRRPPMGAPLTPGAAPRLRPRRPAGPPAGSEVAGGPAAGPEPASGEDLFDPGRPTRAVPERIPMRAGTPHRERTPIYDEVASAWFRESPPSAGPDEAEWASSTGDEGWRAAAASADALDAGLGGAGTTEAGLPRRRPRAHLVPGAARPGGAGEGPAPGPAGPRRSAEAIRGRLASYQQGVADGRTTRRARADTEGEPGARPGDEEEQ